MAEYSEARLGSLHPPQEDRPARALGTDPFITGWYAALDAVRADLRQLNQPSRRRRTCACPIHSEHDRDCPQAPARDAPS